MVNQSDDKTQSGNGQIGKDETISCEDRMKRTAEISRRTKETEIELRLDLDGTGRSTIQTGVGFLDHMLTLFARHAMLDLQVSGQGDLHVDGHHLVEDMGIVLGEAFYQGLGDKRGIRRYGHFLLPMDETLMTCAIDFGGRPHFVYKVSFPTAKIGEFDSELIHEFWQGFVMSARCNLHFQLNYGSNSHHIAESMFKGVARAIRTAIERDAREEGVPSTKGIL
ncbi:MAG: imidazoleglycerol-phosphate dehydratase HisB [Thermoguttaceae bacterium]